MALMQGWLKCASVVAGGLSVIITGMLLMLLLPADS